jgi:hypothetical protein
MSALCDCGSPATVGSFCTQDLDRFRSAIHQAPGVIRDLDVTITGQDAQGGQGNGGGTPDPFNERASDARIALTTALREAALTADATGKGKTPPEHAAMALGGIVGLARNPRAPGIYEALRTALREADHVRDRVEERVSYGACFCGTEITAPRSKDTATCRGCGEQYDVHHIRAWKHVQALDRVTEYRGTQKAVTTVLEGAGYNVNLNTVKSWIRRGKLEPEDDGLYSAKKIINLLLVG